MSHAIEFIETSIFTRQIKALATAEVIYLVLAYAKNEKESLTAAEKAELKKLTQLLKGEHHEPV